MLFTASTSIVLLGTAFLGSSFAKPINEEGRGPFGPHAWPKPAPQHGDLSHAQLPDSCLPGPSDGLVLKYVVIGIGTQNYTCDTNNPSSAPVSAGAVATLYDASTEASWLARLRSYTIKAFFQGSIDLPIIGQHFFQASTAIFVIHSDLFQSRRLSNCPAPADSFPRAPKEQGGAGGHVDSTQVGAIDWLKLVDAGGSVGIKEVYRVVTNGGKAPADCTNQPGVVTSKYTAEYWMFG